MPSERAINPSNDWDASAKASRRAHQVLICKNGEDGNDRLMVFSFLRVFVDAHDELKLKKNRFQLLEDKGIPIIKLKSFLISD